MRVREATLEDRPAWDAFVDGEGGGFCLYFDWKYVHEAAGLRFIPLLAETAPSRLAGILPMVKEDHRLYCTLDAGRAGGGAQGFLLKRGLSDAERDEATSSLLQHVEAHYSRRCSSFKLAEAPLAADDPSEEPTPGLVNNGFGFTYDRGARLPCCFVLPLCQPFEEKVWKGWSRKLKQEIYKAARSGVVVVDDREFRHAEDFVVMLSENVRRHGVRPPSRQEMMLEMEVFREKSKLFVALLDGKPVVTLLCHYTPSTCYLVRVGSHEKDTNSANRLCYKAAIEDACNSGFRFANLGYTPTESLAFFKERFKGIRVPVRVYEKRYSILGTIMEKGPVRISRVWHNRGHVWSNRGRLWRGMVHS